MSIQLLERRRLLHAAFIDDGVLRFLGENNVDDVMIVDLFNGQVRVRATNDSFTSSFDVSSVRAVSVTGGSGNDSLTIDPAIGLPTTLQGGDGADTLIGGPGKDRMEGGIGNDEILGNGGRDLIFGGAGDDTISGGTRNDTIDGGAGADVLVGSAGLGDQLTYATRTADITIVIDGLANDGESGEGDNVSGTIEHFTGGSGNDAITGNAKANNIDGGAGNDTLLGGSGDDQLIGGPGRDILRGFAGTDFLDAQDGEIDTLSGGGGIDLASQDGNDVLEDVLP